MSESKTIVLEKDFLNVNEAAMYMGCTPTGFRKMAKAFDIPSAKVPGGRIIYRRNDLYSLNEQYFTAPKIRLEAFDLWQNVNKILQEWSPKPKSKSTI